MRILINAILMLLGAEVYAQKPIMNGEIALSTVTFSANYAGFITNHFSKGAKLGLIALGAKANYYLRHIDYKQWNGHAGLGYELSFAWIVPNVIYGPTRVIGTEHISPGDFLIGLERGVMGASYGNTTDNSGKPIYPIIN